jgi:hypothetical protein
MSYDYISQVDVLYVDFDNSLSACRTLKTVDELVQKLEFDGPSVSITSKNLALGISTLNHGKFNGTSFSAFIQPNTTDLQVRTVRVSVIQNSYIQKSVLSAALYCTGQCGTIYAGTVHNQAGLP